jgi:AraC family transcriptional regulator
MTSQSEVKITVKEMPDMHVAYVRHIGPYKGNAALFEGLFAKLCGWAGPRGLIRPPETDIEGEIGSNVVVGGRYAVGRFELLPSEYEEAWTTIMGGWLPESGYQCDDEPCYELYHNDPKTHPEGKSIVDICVPVKPL